MTPGFPLDAVDAETRAELCEIVLPMLGLTAGDLARARIEQLAAPKVAGPPTVGSLRVYGPGWSVVLKVIRHAEGGEERWRSTADPSHAFYWQREALAFRSGLLDLLRGGLRAPACYGERDRTDGSVAIWLEDLGGESASTWPPARYALAAKHVGRTQGQLIEAAELELPWLSNRWLRTYLHRRRDDGDILDDRDAWTHPLVRAVLPIRRSGEFRELWSARAELLGVLDAAPKTLSHLDLNPRNLFAVETGTAAIDWAFVGTGALGEDLACMLVDAMAEFVIDPAHLEEHFRTMVAAYIGGLADAGCDIGEDQVRRLVAAAAAAKYGWIVPAVLSAAVAERPTLNGRPIAEAASAWGTVGGFLLDLGELALR